jgi:hypothetical protein
MTIQKEQKPSELLLDKFCCGDATAEETELVKKWLAGNSAAERELSRRKNEAESAFSLVQTFDALSGKVAKRSAPSLVTIPRFCSTGMNRAIFAGILLVIVSAAVWQVSIGRHTAWNIKGSDQVYCIVKHGESVEMISDSGSCIPGDTVQLYYKMTSHPFVMALYSEGVQAFKSCLPADSAVCIVPSDQKVALPFSMVVDSCDAPLHIAVIASEKQFTQAQGKDWLNHDRNGKMTITRYKLLRKQP